MQQPPASRDIRLTVCELRDHSDGFADDWSALTAYVARSRPDVVLLPECVFAPWVFATRPFREATWSAARRTADRWLARLGELGDITVLGSHPVDRAGNRRNAAFVSMSGQITWPHDKHYLPDEPGFWEASWYAAGPPTFDTATVGHDLVAGFLICTEMWFPERAREYAAAGAHLVVTPRATWASRYERWVAGARALGIISGCYSASSVKTSAQAAGDALGGHGWIIDPDGELLAETSADSMFATASINLERAEGAKLEYPRYVWNRNAARTLPAPPERMRLPGVAQPPIIPA